MFEVAVKVDDAALLARQHQLREAGLMEAALHAAQRLDVLVMDILVFERRASGGTRTPPVRVTVQPGDVDFGLIVNQDVEALGRVQRGLHQPGFTELVLSGEECRIVNLHRNLEHFLGITPSEITGG